MTDNAEKIRRQQGLTPQLRMLEALRHDLGCINLNYDNTPESVRLTDKQSVILNQLTTLARHLEKFIENGCTVRQVAEEEVKNGKSGRTAVKTNNDVEAALHGF